MPSAIRASLAANMSPVMEPWKVWPGGSGSIATNLSPEQVARDDLLHHFIAAAGNAGDPCIHIGLGHRIFTPVAVAAEELQAFVDDLSVSIGHQQLHLSRFHRSEESRVGKECVSSFGFRG